jgi:pimeloyl-ACP methyl ester carboxylesterase
MRMSTHPIRSCRLVAALALLGTLAASSNAPAEPPDEGSGETVILLHGLGRGAGSMEKLGASLASHGYAVRALDYPSRSASVEVLAKRLAREVEDCCTDPPQRVHFVGHSLGGIVVRAYLSETRPPALGRVVMLAPPNQGSELVDGVQNNAFFRLFAGPAASELGTDDEGAPVRLGPVDFELGVIAGDRSWNPIGSWLIPGEDDGTVAVARARVEGMTDFRVVPETHTFIMRSPEVAREVRHFLEQGRFSPRAE